MKLDAVPDGLNALELSDEIEHLAQRVGRFLAEVGDDLDDVELWVRRTSRWGWRIADAELTPDMVPALDEVAIRVFRDGEIGESHADLFDETTWRTALADAITGLTPAEHPLPPTPRARRPGPMTFDADLADALASKRELHRVAFALHDNLWHEASRIEGVRGYEGHIAYTARRYLVGTRNGVVASLHGALGARVELNGLYGDVFQQTHAPESLLPLALLGARTWRTMPRVQIEPGDLGLVGRCPVVFHPRLLERLVRALAGPVFLADEGDGPYDEGEVIAAPAVTLVDDSGLDGLTTSRAFDDEGVPTRRTPLMVRGRLTQRVHPRRVITRAGITVGNRWRLSPRGAHKHPPALAFSSLLMERGDVGFHDMVAAVDRTVLVHEIDGFEVLDPITSHFAFKVRWGVSLERGGESRLLAPGKWRIEGYLFGLPDQPPGIFDDVVLSRELHDTGSAIFPYCMAFARVTMP
ncbi:MAG: metallopeptidase TldD-related protein [bacterium]